MAPSKPGNLMKTIRKQAAADAKARGGSAAGSAYAAQRRKNADAKRGYKRAYTDLDGNDTLVQAAATKPKKAPPKRVTKPKKPAAKKEKAPVIEVWRPAGGEQPKKREKTAEKLTKTLGLARVSTWRVAEFQEAAENLIEQHGDFDDVMTSELVHGGESVTDVWFEFRSELVAEAVKEAIDGQMVMGRKLQVTFA